MTFLQIKSGNSINLLTFNKKWYIVMANVRTFCFKTSQGIDVEEECLKSKMREKLNLSITMTVYQIESLRKCMRYWFLMTKKKELL